MKNKVFGTMVAGAVAGMLVGGVAMAKDKKAGGKKGAKDASGWCKSNDCAGKIEGAKNDCKGKMACKGVDQAKCETAAAGTWTTEPKPK